MEWFFDIFFELSLFVLKVGFIIYKVVATKLTGNHLNQWDMYRRTAEIEGILSLKEKMRGSLTTAMNNSDPERQQVLQKALSEWDHPDFLVYLRAKLGSV